MTSNLGSESLLPELQQKHRNVVKNMYELFSKSEKNICWRGYSRKNQNRGVEDKLFWKRPRNFDIFTLPLEIPEKTSLHPWKFCKIVWQLLEIWPLEFPHALSSILLGVPCARPQQHHHHPHHHHHPRTHPLTHPLIILADLLRWKSNQ